MVSLDLLLKRYKQILFMVVQYLNDLCHRLPGLDQEPHYQQHRLAPIEVVGRVLENVSKGGQEWLHDFNCGLN
jgi:hypothetical protein